MSENFINEIKSLTRDDIIKENEPMSIHTTMQVGGNARYFFTPENEEELVVILKKLRENDCPYFVKGNGSNIIIRDEGFEGAVIDFGKMNKIEVRGDEIFAQCGASLKDVSQTALNESLTGFEFACGIPGSVGGAVFMNAGAYDGEMKTVVSVVEVLNENLDKTYKTNEEMKFAYRTSSCKSENLIVLGATFKLQKGEKSGIKEKIDDFTFRREDKQPLEYPSCGSTFKRPEGYFAGKLISDAGLKGYMHGGAQVSDKHAGFVINKNNATATEVLELIDIVKKKVFENSGVMLECEVRVM